MKVVHLISILIAAALLAALYFRGDTTPPKTNEPMASAHETAEAIAFDALYAEAYNAVDDHAKEEIDSLLRVIKNTKDSVQMAGPVQELARTWLSHQQYYIGGYYQSLEARLVNSEKKLNFAGQFFLELMALPNQNPARITWAAQQAIAALEQSVQLNPQNDTPRLGLALAYVEGTGETMSGVQQLLAITRKEPNHITANLMLGKMAIQSGQLDKAVERLETVIRQEPKNKEAIFFLAEAYKGLGNKQKAVELLNQVKKIVNNPDFDKDIDQYIKSFE